MSFSCKGPLITEDSMMAPYEEGKNDTVRWIDRPLGDDKDITTRMFLLDDWWDKPKTV